MSAVVLEELYGGGDAQGRRLLAQMESHFEKVNRILVPNLADWTTCGDVLGKFGAKYGYDLVGRSRLTNDALIAMSIARYGITLQTVNARDLVKIAEFRSFKWEIV